MKQHSFILLFAVVALGMTLQGCKKKTNKIWYIKNSCSEVLNVGARSFRNDTMTLTIDTGWTETLMIYPDDGDNAFSENPGDNLRVLNILRDGASCDKDYKIKDNWQIVQKTTKNTGADYLHEYTFELKDTDF